MIHSRRVHRRALRRGVGSFQSGLYSACGVARFQASSNAALHVGPLWVSQPFLVIIDPIVSVALSVWLFGERFTSDAAVLAVAAVAFAVMCAAVVLLTQTAPATMKADIPADKGSDGQQARVTGVQGADGDLPPGRAARDRGRPGSGHLPPG